MSTVVQSSQNEFGVVPPIDVFEDLEGVTVWIDLPGVPRDQLDVKVHDGRLTIEARPATPPQGQQIRYAEARATHFSRAFSLGSDFDGSKIDASLQDGVLRLTVPRRTSAKPRRIEVAVA